MSDNRRDRDAYAAPNGNPDPAPPNAATSGQQQRLYDRRFSVVVANDAGQALDLSALRCDFIVRQYDIQTPNSCDLHITNVSKATAARMQKEFTRVQISAGYPGIYGVIFDGTVIQSRFGRDSPTDTYLHLVATDGDQSHNWATLNTTVAAGSTPKDVHRVVLKAMNPYGTVEGYTDPAMTGPALPRGKVLFGMARDTMRDLARTTGTSWAITHGRMDVVSRDGYLPNEAVVINAQTGMVGLPVITPEGVIVRCLLNPLLRVSQRIKLDNASIQQPRNAPVTVVGDPNFTLNYPPGLVDADGIYKVMAVDHTGDTRGNKWYSEIVCVGSTISTTSASAARGRQGDPKPLTPAAPAAAAPPARPVAPLSPAATDPNAPSRLPPSPSQA